MQESAQNLPEAAYYNSLARQHKGNYKRLQELLERFGSWRAAAFQETGGIDPEKEWQILSGKGIDLVLLGDPRYPKLLKEISYPPLGIYVRGNLNYSQPAIAIVGTRSVTPAGQELARKFSFELARAGLAVISGLALGVDAAAHQGALDANGKTLAVLGTPSDYLYPRSNEGLAKEILNKGGAIISEFSIGHEFQRSNFLIRNRIISGLADAALIIEAPEKSGALATAKFALEQNRELFVIPGSITVQNYRGSNSLIKAGAGVVTEPKDILDFFKIQLRPKFDSEREDDPILAALAEEPLNAETLMVKTSLPAADLNKNLAILTIKGIIKELNGKYYLS